MNRWRVTAGVLAAWSTAAATAQTTMMVPYGGTNPVPVAQTTMMVPYGGTNPVPVAQTPAATDDGPQEIAKDAARDIKSSSFYNRPGATRADYDAAWQDCRLIARGSRTPSGMVPYSYNPALVSPVAAGAGGALGALIAGAIAEGQQRRANRRACLMIRGWRMVELGNADAARVSAMTDPQRSAWFDTVVGVPTPPGTIVERTSFSLKLDPAIDLDAPVAGAGTVFLGKKVDPRTPLTLAPNEGAVVVAWRRPIAATAGRAGTLQLVRYDTGHRDALYRPKDWKKLGDQTTYAASVHSGDRQSVYEVQVVKLTAGDYVIDSTAVGGAVPMTSNCFGAPVFHVGAGEVVYLGDFLPYWNVKLSDGSKLAALARASHPDEARRTLASAQPALAGTMRSAGLRNGATYACSAVQMDRWDIAGAPMVDDTR